MEVDFKYWLQNNLPRHGQLTETVKTIVGSLLLDSGIEYLSIDGRTKTKDEILKKIERKKYRNPKEQLTDISGIRIILFIESDISKVSKIIESAFDVDSENSSNTDEKLNPNQVGYRSVHYVCELGSKRTKLPEFKNLDKLKFEFQIRTVLQHAWAELAHDRSYKFQTALPQEIQRKLYLHAGLLEIADKGFSEISQEIDAYTNEVTNEYDAGNLNININSVSILSYINYWSKDKNIELVTANSNANFSELINELNEFDVNTIADLSKLCPPKYAEEFKKIGLENTLFGVIRDWMIIKDAHKMLREVKRDWVLGAFEEGKRELEIYENLVSPEDFEIITEEVNQNPL